MLLQQGLLLHKRTRLLLMLKTNILLMLLGLEESLIWGRKLLLPPLNLLGLLLKTALVTAFPFLLKKRTLL